ncbi:Plasmid stabilization system protein ParE [Nitrosomonas sp. Nm51]|uniref:type II toxin-antitoxin system RelE/ParE family toxin n=1 Tax=Nitrosomonas sp. Nm51 TaxID=133720 RepID=UPI0008AEAF22|nr:type II toxin-antitoxin system RelE/ParE family toxin [Nitrosomonas sp. Nm51]SER63341.1 Plasmid stabilization system protein ParE [Nitrosomonas sp. Nm51]
MPDYKITAHAEQDLRDIARYTIDKWGMAQAERYEAILSKRFQEIAQRVVTPRIFLKKRPDLMFTHCEHHYICYLQSKNSANPIILAVLHERMDLMRRLKNRLVT